MARVSWDEAEEKAKNAGGGTFIALKADKDKVVGVFVGDPDARETFWTGSKSVAFTEEHAKAGKSPQLKIKFNFALFKQGNGDNVAALDKPVMKVLEINAKTFNAVLKAKKKYGLDKFMFEIERSGAKGDTSTTYSVLSDEEITDAQKTLIEALKPHDLDKAEDDEEDFESYDKGKDGAKDGKSEKGEKKKTEKPPADKSADKAADKPAAPAADAIVSPEVAQQLVGRLKPLDRELGVNKFLSKFGIAKIKELKQKDFAEADAFITALEKPADAPGATEEEDPFA